MDTNDVSPSLPSSREIELETALRQRDAQVLSLSDEVARLRYYLTKQAAPSSTDAVPLPPALVTMLLPHIDAAREHALGAGINSSGTSTTITAALTARAKLLQEENEELYDLLKHDETGRLKEEVRALRRVVDRLESALRDSHNVIMNLSSELDKSYESFYNNNNNNPRDRHHSNYRHTQSPPVQRVPLPSTNAGPTNGTATSANKPPPTGPKALKRPRLSAANSVTAAEGGSIGGSNNSGNNRNNNITTNSNSNTGARGSVPSSRSHEVRSTGAGDSGGGGTSMDVDDDAHGSTSSRDTRTHHRPHYHSSSQQQRHSDRDRDRERERGRDERERERERERDRGSDWERDRDRDRDHDRGSRDRDWDRSAARERERDRDRGDEREYERDRERQRERDRGNRNKDRGSDSGRGDRQHHDREREREKEGGGSGGGGGRSSRNGRHNSRRRRGPVGGGGGNLQDLGDRTLAERMGLKS